jgi:hypothetical protein
MRVCAKHLDRRPSLTEFHENCGKNLTAAGAQEIKDWKASNASFGPQLREVWSFIDPIANPQAESYKSCA